MLEIVNNMFKYDRDSDKDGERPSESEQIDVLEEDAISARRSRPRGEEEAEEKTKEEAGQGEPKAGKAWPPAHERCFEYYTVKLLSRAVSVKIPVYPDRLPITGLSGVPSNSTVYGNTGTAYPLTVWMEVWEKGPCLFPGLLTHSKAQIDKRATSTVLSV